MPLNHAPVDGTFISGFIRCPGCGHQVRVTVRLTTSWDTAGPRVSAQPFLSLSESNHTASCNYAAAVKKRRAGRVTKETTSE